MVYTMATIKGGTGKTSTAAAMAQYAALQGSKVLCIDFEPQADLTAILGGTANHKGAFELIEGAPADECIQTTNQNIDIICGGDELSAITTETGRGYRLKEAIKPLKRKYDIIIIDTPPQIGELLYNALIACDSVIMPLACDLPSIRGMLRCKGIAEELTKQTSSRKKKMHAFITDYSGRTNFEKKVCSIAEHSCAIQEAQALQKNLFKHARKSKTAVDYVIIFERMGIIS